MQHEWKRTKLFSRLACPKIFATGATDLKVPADLSFLDWRERTTSDRRPIFILPGATESFCDWCGRSITARHPQFFATEKTEAQMAADRSVFALGATKNFTTARPMQKFTPNEDFLRLARRNIFATDENDPKMNADQKNFAPGSTESFNDWRERCKNEADRKIFCTRRDRMFLRLARTMQKWRTTEVFLRLARPKVFTSGANDAKMIADRSVFAPRATESFFDWRGRSTSVRRPNFFATGATEFFNDWRQRCKNECRPKFLCAWREW